MPICHPCSRAPPSMARIRSPTACTPLGLRFRAPPPPKGGFPAHLTQHGSRPSASRYPDVHLLIQSVSLRGCAIGLPQRFSHMRAPDASNVHPKFRMTRSIVSRGASAGSSNACAWEAMLRAVIRAAYTRACEGMKGGMKGGWQPAGEAEGARHPPCL